MREKGRNQLTKERYIVVGGAGFIGSHFVDRLLADPLTGGVTVYDNFTSGRRWHIESHLTDPRFAVVEDDVKDVEALTKAMAGHQTAIHLASNPDIAKAATQPDVDFYEGTLLTHQVVEAARRAELGTVLYAKLAGEALLSSYSFMFDLRCRAFRFGNVVGPHQTHGVGFDFVRRLLKDPERLDILGDGQQSKSYIHVYDVIDAVLMAHAHGKEGYAVYNVATGDYITVTEIAELAAECVGLQPGSVQFTYAGGDRGWKGDVPIVRLSTDRIRAIGWRCKRSSREALRAAMMAMVGEFKSGQM